MTAGPHRDRSASPQNAAATGMNGIAIRYPMSVASPAGRSPPASLATTRPTRTSSRISRTPTAARSGTVIRRFRAVIPNAYPPSARPAMMIVVGTAPFTPDMLLRFVVTGGRSPGAVSDRGRGVRSKGERPPARGAPREGTAIMKLTTMTQVTVDGVVQGNGHASDEDRKNGFDRGGWAKGAGDDETRALITATYQRADAFLFGRRTYELFAGSWGTADEMRAHPIGVALDKTPKYVASNTLTEPGWAGTTALSGDLAAAVGQLKGNTWGESGGPR